MSQIESSTPHLPVTHFIVALVLFFLSGSAALIYEILWMKELGLLFGNTAQATATTLATFFLGLAGGAYIFGQKAPYLENPLRTYALLEIAVALSATGYFLILPLYHKVYPLLFEQLNYVDDLFVATKFALALVVFSPPAFFLGATFPVMAQYVVRHMHTMGRRVSILYAINTLGAATGALVAGFYLPLLIGFHNAYLFAMGLSIGVGLLALWFSRNGKMETISTTATSARASNPQTAALKIGTLRGLAFLSGLVTLCLQVLWTRMFAQVLQNSVYTFAAILVTFLLCLALGAGLAHRLMRIRKPTIVALFGVLIVSALLVSSSSFVFDTWTDGLRYVGQASDWTGYLLNVFATVIVVIGPAVLILGAVFPLLLKLAEPHDLSAGRLVGQLIALNTAGAITGSVLAGFVILELIGLWAGIRLMGILYLLTAVHLAYQDASFNRAVAALPMIGIVALTSVLDSSHLPLVRIDPIGRKETLLKVWEGSAGTVAVVRKDDSLKIKVNNHYALGGTASGDLEALQGYLPILLHPEARSVYVLGLGTGITAGASLRFPIEKLVVTELVAEVVQASRSYFEPFNHGLFADRRAQVIVEDGRNYLAGTRDRFDVIIADLFVPWKAGTGNLYTLEHFQSVFERLQDDGLFMQWLPTYQLSQDGFAVIVRTLLEVFPQVTVWRGDFFSRKPIVGLLAQKQATPLSPGAPLFTSPGAQVETDRIPLLAHYIGNLEGLRTLFSSYPINRDDYPIIEYQAPIAQRLQRANKSSWLSGGELMHFMTTVQDYTPLDADPYLREVSAQQRSLSTAGLYLHRAQILKEQGEQSSAEDEYRRYQDLTGS